MSKPKIFVTRKLPGPAMDMLDTECDMTVNPHDRPVSRKELEKAIEGIDGLLCLLTDTIDEDLLAKSTRLKIVSNYAVGYDNIDVDACSKRNIAVSNTPGVLTEATADLAWALLMAGARRLVEADRYVREGRFKSWGPMLFLGHEVNNKTLGIVGFGRIGRAVAKRAGGFNMRILYNSRSRVGEEVEKSLGVEYRPLNQLFKEADYISLHLPLNEETRQMIGAKELKLMKSSAILVNTSRGPVIDEKALVRALKQNEIAGAALDVYEHEPALAPGLTELPNAVLAPHIASATTETRTKMAVMAVKNLLAGLKGEKIPNLVNRELNNLSHNSGGNR